MCVGKDVSGIVEYGKADVVLEKRQGRRRSAEFNIVDEQGRATQREIRSRDRAVPPDSIQIRDASFRPRRKNARPEEGMPADRAEAADRLLPAAA